MRSPEAPATGGGFYALGGGGKGGGGSGERRPAITASTGPQPKVTRRARAGSSTVSVASCQVP
jgi:hypothetical protein